MFALKQGVNPNGVQREIWYAIGVCSEIFSGYGATLVVTSLTDGKHNEGSLHPKGWAADLRVLNLAEAERIPAYESVNRRLNALGFDVEWEGGVGATPATTGAHIHVEFQPKLGEKFINYTK